MSEKRFQGEKGKKNGFYIALGVCLVAVGIAAWSTYDAVDNYAVQEESAVQDAGISVQSEPEPEKENKADKEDGEALKKNEKKADEIKPRQVVPEKPEISKPKPEKPSKPAKENAAENAAENEAAPENNEQAADAEVVQEEEIPANTGVLYEISEIMEYPTKSKEIAVSYSNGMPVYSETMKDWRVHAGVDYKSESGDEVTACANGIVSEIKQDTMLGNVAVVEHGEYVFYYCGLGENMSVAQGDTVSTGQAIGTVSSVPFESAENAHLHLEVKRDNVYLNPEDVISDHQ